MLGVGSAMAAQAVLLLSQGREGHPLDGLQPLPTNSRSAASIAEGKKPIGCSNSPPAARQSHSSVNDDLINPETSAPQLQCNGVHTPSPWGTRSFADTVRNAAHRPHSAPIPNCMKPSKEGDFFSIEIDDGIYQQGVAILQECLIGRIVMSQGDKPYTTFELGEKLHKEWLMQGTMELIPIGRGYHTIRFSLLEDRDRIFKKKHWLLCPGVFRLQSWVQDFNPKKACSSRAQVWVRISDLPLEYWQPAILEAMASACGTLLKIDHSTLHRKMGHYARMLVEIDMKTDLPAKIMYKRSGICSFANLLFERLPDFCRDCGIVGHTTTACTRGKKIEKEGKNRGRNRRRSASRKRSLSRQRDSSAPTTLGVCGDSTTHTVEASDQKNESYTNALEDDVLHGNYEDMHGNKVFALPPIPTKNAFEALIEAPTDSQEEATTLMSLEASTQVVGQDCQVIEDDVLYGNVDDKQGELTLALPPIPTMDSPRVSPKSCSPTAHETLAPQDTNPTHRAFINKFNQSKSGTSLMAPRRCLKSVVDDLSTSAQESFVVGPAREQNLVAREPWSDIAEQEHFKKSLKHGFKIRKNRL